MGGRWDRKRISPSKKMPSEDLDALLTRARTVRGNAYAPYSNFAVGAAVLCDDGSVFEGANVENASYGLSLCAERAAIACAIAAGRRVFRAIAIAGPNGTATVPCGSCRQVLNEFNAAMPVIYTTPDGSTQTTLDRLLPQAFGPASLDAHV